MNEFTKEELQNEVWKDVPEFEGIYQVSDLGRVKSLNYNHTKEERILKPSVDTGGYYQVLLFKNGKGTTRKIHQWVAIAFLNHVPCGHLIEVNHKDEVKLNNRLTNLELLTKKEHDEKTFKNKSSKYTGVTFHKRLNKWKTYIRVNGKIKHLGYFHTELQAHEAVQKAEENVKKGDLSFMKFREKTSKYKGVCFDKQTQKWIARITINGKQKFLGSFPTEIEAHKSVLKELENLK